MVERWRLAAILVAMSPACAPTFSSPTVSSFTARPAVPSGPAVPTCTRRLVQTDGVGTGDVVVCRAGHTVPYGAMQRAGLLQAASDARALGKTHVSLTTERHFLTAASVSAVICTDTTPAQEWTCAGGKGCYP